MNCTFCSTPRYVVDLKQDGEESADEETNPFKWMIEGFSTLLTAGAETYYSGRFDACGFTWKLQLEPNSSEEDGEKSVSLRLLHDFDASSSAGSVVKAIYRLFIYDLLSGQHVQKEGEDYFHSTSSCGSCCKVLLKKFNDPKSGLIVNDCCIFGAEIQDAFTCKLDRKVVSECWSVNKEMPSVVVYSWVIKDFLKLDSRLSSETFGAGGHKWFISIHTNVAPRKDWLGIFLKLDNPTALPSETSVSVDFTLSLLNQIDGKHEKRSARCQFSSKNAIKGWPDFLRWKDAQDPSKKFLRNEACIIEASLTVLGEVTVL